jgi:hypothetical protein
VCGLSASIAAKKQRRNPTLAAVMQSICTFAAFRNLIVIGTRARSALSLIDKSPAAAGHFTLMSATQRQLAVG